MLVRVALAVCAVALLLVSGASAQSELDSEAPQDLSLVEVGSRSTINSAAAGPLQEIARLLADASDSVHQLKASRKPVQVLRRDVTINTQHNIVLKRKQAKKVAKKKKGKVTAELRARLAQPTIHDEHRFGTKWPINPKKEWVNAAIVGEDGKPYRPRKQWSKIAKENRKNVRSPFAKFIHPPKVGAAADVENKDPNTKLTKVELKAVNSLQLRLKNILDQLGANIVWDNTKIKNRRVITEFENLKTEARALLEEYELRTGVKTIAWQLGKPDFRGLQVPNGRVKDIYFADHPELRTRVLQRRGSRKYPPPPTAAMMQEAAAAKAAAAGLKPGETAMKKQEQEVSVAWRKGEDGVVKAKVKLNIVDSKIPADPNAPPNLGSRPDVPGKVYPSGKVGSPSQAVDITVVAPADELLSRTAKNIGREPEPSLVQMNL